MSEYTMCKFRNGPMDGEEREVSNACHSAEFDKVMTRVGSYEVVVYMRSCADDKLFLFSHCRKLSVFA